VIVAAGTLTLFACLGLGRFALGMLLPSMSESLPLTYAEMGFISTGNFVGYLAAVVAAGWLVRRLGSRSSVGLGLAVVGLSMLLVGRAGGFSEVLVLYVITGIGSGVANVPMMGLVSLWFARRHRGKAAGFMVIGSGFAIIFAGQIVPWINLQYGAEGWRTGWSVLGGVVLAVALVCALLLRNRPEELSLSPVGADADPRAPQESLHMDRPARRRTLAHLGAIYFLFGATYVIYATFIVTSLVQERGFPETTAGTFWAWLGALSLLSGQFGTLSDRAGRRAGLSLVFALHTAAYVLAAAHLPLPFLYLSIGLFGISAWAIPSIMAAAVGDYMGAEHAAQAFGLITLFFGIGQILGPAVAGLAAEATGTFAVSFLIAAALAASAIVLAAFLRRPSH
jgi:MFS family permease